jgi:hypothetical protein
VSVVTVENLERAMQLASESSYALTASGWTESEENAERMMVGVQAGVLTINDVLYAYGEPAATWSGFKRSGLGHSHGLSGLKEMSRRRFVSFDARDTEAPLFAFPYGDAADAVVDAVTDSLHAPSRWARPRGSGHAHGGVRSPSRGSPRGARRRSIDPLVERLQRLEDVAHLLGPFRALDRPERFRQLPPSPELPENAPARHLVE